MCSSTATGDLQLGIFHLPKGAITPQAPSEIQRKQSGLSCPSRFGHLYCLDFGDQRRSREDVWYG